MASSYSQAKDSPFFTVATFNLPKSKLDRNATVNETIQESLTISCYRDITKEEVNQKNYFILLRIKNQKKIERETRLSVVFSTHHSISKTGLACNFKNEEEDPESLKTIANVQCFSKKNVNYVLANLSHAYSYLTDLSIHKDIMIGEVKVGIIDIECPEFLYQDRIFEFFEPIVNYLAQGKINFDQNIHDAFIKSAHTNNYQKNAVHTFDQYVFYFDETSLPLVERSLLTSSIKLQISEKNETYTNSTSETINTTEPIDLHTLMNNFSRENGVTLTKSVYTRPVLPQPNQKDILTREKIEQQTKTKEASDKILTQNYIREVQTSQEQRNTNVIGPFAAKTTDNKNNLIVPVGDQGLLKDSRLQEGTTSHFANIQPAGRTNIQTNKIYPSNNISNILREYGPKKSEAELKEKRISELMISYSGPAKGLVGFLNSRQNCHINAPLQVLLHSPLFSTYFFKELYLESLNSKFESKYATTFGKIIEITRSISQYDNKDKYPVDLFRQLKHLQEIVEINKENFNQNQPKDPYEFINLFLDGLSKGLNRVQQQPNYQLLKKLQWMPSKMNTREIQSRSDEWYNYALSRENSIVTDLFNGQLFNRITCTKCGYSTGSFENYMSLSLGFRNLLNPVCNFQDMMEDILREEDISDPTYCDNCMQTHKMKTKSYIWKLPEILIIHFKRFKPGYREYQKIETPIVFPLKTLDMKPFSKVSEDISTKDTKYTLFALITHKGALEKGRFVALFIFRYRDCKNLYDKQWYEFDDDLVTKLNVNPQEKEICCRPYMLFYVKSSRVY